MASGMPKPVCSNHTATNCPVMSIPSLPNSRSMGTKATWIGTTSSDTTMMNSRSLPRNCMNVNAYAANAANMIGMTVAGMDTVIELMNAVPMLLSAMASWKLVTVRSVPNWLVSVVHQPEDTASSWLRKDVISRPMVGTVHSTQ